jgi:hypothetical protein
MKNILFYYPSLFNCESKFDRKVKSIVKNLTDFKVCYLHDENKLLTNLLGSNDFDVATTAIENIDFSEITHAIVFDDGESFQEELVLLKEHGIALRIISIKTTKVINIKRESQYQGLKSTANYEYIGRGSYWGNPYSLYEDGDDRDEVIRKYKYDFDYEKFPNKEKIEVHKLTGKTLGCFCKPSSCHGDVLANYLNAHDDGK